MSDENIKKENTENTGQGKSENSGKVFDRRDVLQGLATVPALGVFGYFLTDKRSRENARKKQLLEELGLDNGSPAVHTGPKEAQTGTRLRIGIIGHGGRGGYLTHSAGFAHPDWKKRMEEEAAKGKRNIGYENYLRQDDLNIQLKGVCDVFDVRAKNAMEKGDKDTVRYMHYKEMLADDEIDAVIIATPDHWHAQMVIDAAAAGKHVYVEKCITRTIDEVFKVREAVKKSDIVFQLGHQNRQTDAYFKAKEIIDKGIIGKINLLEATTNRNSPGGAWVYNIHPEGSPKTIDFDQFLGSAPQVPFSLERFFRWRCWFDYGTGLAGDLLTHDYDAMNQMLGLGIPASAVSSGGIYYYKDGRDVPDVWHVTYEYPEKDLTFFYSATLASNKSRGKYIMGHDGSIDLSQLYSSGLRVYADSNSTKYKDKIRSGLIDLSLPMFTYQPGVKGIAAVTSASSQYFLGRGLMYTMRGGKMLDATYLHIKEWIDAIRGNGKPSCNIDRGFEEGITAHMGTLAYREGRKVRWDAENEKVI